MAPAQLGLKKKGTAREPVTSTTLPFITMAIQNFFIETTAYKFSDYIEEKWYYGLSRHEVDNDKINLAILNKEGAQKAISIFGKEYLYLPVGGIFK